MRGNYQPATGRGAAAPKAGGRKLGLIRGRQRRPDDTLVLLVKSLVVVPDTVVQCILQIRIGNPL